MSSNLIYTLNLFLGLSFFASAAFIFLFHFREEIIYRDEQGFEAPLSSFFNNPSSDQRQLLHIETQEESSDHSFIGAFPSHVSTFDDITNAGKLATNRSEHSPLLAYAYRNIPDTLRVPAFWDPPAFQEYGGVRQFLGRNGESLISPQQASAIGTFHDGKETIYLTISSYRDMDCKNTLNSLYGEATYPERIRVGLVDQVAEDDPRCAEPEVPCSEDPDSVLCKYAHLIDNFEMDAAIGWGVTLSRHIGFRMYRGEYFAMQVDSHTWFTPGWDEDVIQQWKSAKNEMAVFSTYPAGTGHRNNVTGYPKNDGYPVMCKTRYVSRDHPTRMHISHGGARIRNHGSNNTGAKPVFRDEPTFSPFWGAGFVFGRGHYMVQVPYDPYLPAVFMGEEISMGVRGFTYGYDYYSPPRVNVFHRYGAEKHHAKKAKIGHFWENAELYSGALEAGMMRCTGIIGLHSKPYDRTEVDIYGVGNVRTTKTFYDTFGVDTSLKHVRNGLCDLVGLDESFQRNFTNHIRDDGMGIDYDKVSFNLHAYSSNKFSGLLDFAIIGHSRTGISTIRKWLGGHPEINGLVGEQNDMFAEEPEELVEKLRQLKSQNKENDGNNRRKQMLHSPIDARSPFALQHYNDYFPHALLIVGIRHPIRWFESLYNMKIQSAGVHKDIENLLPNPNELIGNCAGFKKYPCLGTDRGTFHAHLAMMGKVPHSQYAHLNLSLPEGYPSAETVHRISNPIFLYSLDQLQGRNATRGEAFRMDMSTAIGLQEELGPLVKTSQTQWNAAEQARRDKAKIDICDPQYHPVREHLLAISKEASTWILESGFLDSADVTVSSPEYFKQILKEYWMDDPCQNSWYEGKWKQEEQESFQVPKNLPESIRATVSTLKDMGVDFSTVHTEDYSNLPSLEDVRDNFGDKALFRGMDTCQAYRSQVPPQQRIIAPTGLFSSGTNLLYYLLKENCQPPEEDETTSGRFISWQVPWGKHHPLLEKDNYTVPNNRYWEEVNRSSIFPVVAVRHPYTWIKSICQHPYELSWNHNEEECTHRARLDEGVTANYYKHTQVQYSSLAHVWSDWNRQYFEQNSNTSNITQEGAGNAIPHLMIRHEDLIFQPQQVVRGICECVGGRFNMENETFKFRAEKANSGPGHGQERSDLLTAWMRYGQPIEKYKSYYSPEDWKVLHDVTDRNKDMMHAFGYKTFPRTLPEDSGDVVAHDYDDGSSEEEDEGISQEEDDGSLKEEDDVDLVKNISDILPQKGSFGIHVNPNTDTPSRKTNRIYCVVPFLWTRQTISRYNEIVQTWGSRCDVLRFMIDPIIGSNDTGFLDARSLEPESLLENVKIVNMRRPWNDPKCHERRYKETHRDLKMVEQIPCRHLWEKMWRSWVWIAENELDEGDWFVKVDWDTYFFPENLRWWIDQQGWKSSEYHFGGHTLHHQEDNRNITVMAGAVEVFSQATVRDMAKSFVTMPSLDSNAIRWNCTDRPGRAEDVTISVCLKQNLGVLPESIRTNDGCDFITPLTLESHLKGNRKGGKSDGWFWKGKNSEWNYCLDPRPIGLHGLKNPNALLEHENLFYGPIQFQHDDGDGDGDGDRDGSSDSIKSKSPKGLGEKTMEYVTKVRALLHQETK